MRRRPPRVLFVSGGVGLGHVTRDVAIARELRRRLPAIELSWLAGEAARLVLAELGEALHPACARWSDETEVLEAAAAGF